MKAKNFNEKEIHDKRYEGVLSPAEQNKNKKAATVQKEANTDPKALKSQKEVTDPKALKSQNPTTGTVDSSHKQPVAETNEVIDSTSSSKVEHATSLPVKPNHDTTEALTQEGFSSFRQIWSSQNNFLLQNFSGSDVRRRGTTPY